MTYHGFIGFAVVAAVFLAGVSSRPSNEETAEPLTIDIDASDFDEPNDEEKRSLTYEYRPDAGESNLKDILDKIKTVNEGLKSPTKRQPVNYNVEPQTGGGYVIDKDILEKIQQIIAAGKLKPSLTNQHQDSNFLNDDLSGPRHSRDMSFGLTKLSTRSNQEQIALAQNPLLGLPQLLAANNLNQVHMAPMPYVTNMPVMVVPLSNLYNNELQGMNSPMAYSTRQSPSLPFNIPWPLAPFFPILIRDPLLNVIGGGGWSNLVQYGQNADVCNRKQKSAESEPTNDDSDDEVLKIEDENVFHNIISSRQGRALKKRSGTSKSTIENNIENFNKVKKIFSVKTTTPKPIKSSYTAISNTEEQQHDTKTANFDDGDLRFSDWTLFGNRKPLAPSPGFFINRLKVRRGGVAIAGPGGVATAGRGGTAIVGPGGLAYTQPGGLAVAGPHARVVAISPDADLSSIVSRLQDQSAIDGSVPRLLEAIPEGRVVAHGPVIYYHPNEQSYYRGWRHFQGDYRRDGAGFSRRSDEYQYNSASLGRSPWKNDSFWLVLKPVAHAISSPRGVAVANPVSNVVISRNDLGTIVHAPVASAVAGPGGIAHAQSDLYLYEYYRASTDYLPFYGGAKGQYLEVKKDNTGTVTSERIVSEDKISSENIVKNSDENLISKVLAANLLSLKTTSSNLLRLHNLGRKTGSLGHNDKIRFKNQLTALGEAASNTIKLIEEIGEDVDMLFKTNVTQRRYESDDYIEEEGVGIEAPTSEDDELPLGGATIAEAKPVGLAVVGENGLAASRPVATAIASNGVALARPIATAVAGVDPAALGINFQINQAKRSSEHHS